MISRTGRALALSLALLGLHAASLAQISKSTAEGLMRKSGLWEQLGGIAPQMEAGLPGVLAQSGTQIPPDEQKRLAQAFASAYSPMHLRSAAIGVLSARLAPADVPKLEAWYDSEDGQAVTRIEEASTANTADVEARLQASAKVLANASSERQALLKRLTVVTHAAEASADIIINSAIGMQEGLARVQPSFASKSSQKEARALLEKQRPQMIQSFESMMVALFAAMYEGADDALLGRYIDFLSSPQGRAYTELSLRAVDRAFVEAGQAFGRSLPAVKSNTNL
jgi:hypothetical protein